MLTYEQRSRAAKLRAQRSKHALADEVARTEADAARLDALQAWAAERRLGWSLHSHRGLIRVHVSQSPQFFDVRAALDALIEQAPR